MESDDEAENDEDLFLDKLEDDADAKQGIVTEYSLTGKMLGKIVLEKMKELNLTLKYCVGIGTDGCAVMLGKIGAVQEIQKEATNASRTPCFSHKLNISISKSAKVPLIEKTNSIIKEVTKFFHNSHPKRNVILAQFLGKKLKMLCETRWVERHDGVLQFTTNLPEIIQGLERVSEWKNKETAGKAHILISAIDGQFIIGLYCLSDILALTHPLSILLQKETIDLGGASKVINSLTSLLETRQNNVSEHFKGIFSEAEKKAQELGIDIKIPRLCRKQTHRANYQTNSVEEYYRITAYIPLLDFVLTDLKNRFSVDILEVFRLSSLLPENVVTLTREEIKDLADFLSKRFAKLTKLIPLQLRGEIEHWQQKWKLEVVRPYHALELLKICVADSVYSSLVELCGLQVWPFCIHTPTSRSSRTTFWSALPSQKMGSWFYNY